jgi:hypothetical protein
VYPYTVKIAVYNSAGEVVKEILVTKAETNVENVTGESDTVIGSVGDQVELYWKGQYLGQWDGTNENGGQVSNGEYYVKVDSADPYGVVRSVTLAVTVARKVAKLSILVYNSGGEVVRHLTEIEASSVPAANQVALSSDVIQPGATLLGVETALTVSVANGPTAVWDGRTDDGVTVADGTYYVEVRSEGEGGTGTVVVKAVSVLGAPKENNLRAVPNVLTDANPGAVLKGKAGETAQAVIYTSAGEKAGVVWGDPGAGNVKWDSTGKASGIYFVVVTTRDAAGRVTDRGVLKLIVQ